MRCKNLLATVILTLLIPASMKATDIYVYHSGNYAPLKTMFSTHKITFTEDSVILLSEKNVIQKASFADFDYLRFYKTPIPTAIQGVRSDLVSIVFDGRQIRVQSPSLINRIELISASGTLLQRLTPRSSSLTYTVTELPAGIYFVKAATEGRVIVKKIIKN